MDISSINNLTLGAAASNGYTPPPPASADQRAIIQAVRAVNSAALFGQENELTFILDRQTHLPAVRVVNKETGDVVAQIPSELLLQMAEAVSGEQTTP